MERVAFVLKIRPDKVDEYVEAHADVWPEMLAAIRTAGISNYTIFLRGTEALGYYEAEDMAEAWRRLGEADVNTRWQAAMAEFLEEEVAEAGPETLRPIFRME